MLFGKNISISFVRGGIKSPWSRRKRKRVLSRQQWDGQFSANGKLRDGGKKVLKKVRSGVSIIIHLHLCDPCVLQYLSIILGWSIYNISSTPSVHFYKAL